MEKRTEVDFIWEYFTTTNSIDTWDEYGRLLYSTKWVVNKAPFHEAITGSEENRQATIGYNLPLDGTNGIKRLWWDLTDIQFQYPHHRPFWINVGIYPFTRWLRRLGYTGFRRSEPPEWKGL